MHILYGGPQLMIIDRHAKVWHFEDHPYCGPTHTNAKGEIKTKQPSEKSPFWECINAWTEQGKRVAATGICIWRPKPEPELVHLGGKNYAEAGSELAKRYGK